MNYYQEGEKYESERDTGTYGSSGREESKMSDLLLTMGQREWIFLILGCYGIIYLLMIFLEKDKESRSRAADRLQNSILLSYLLNRLIFLLTHFSMVLSSPLALIQGRNSFIPLIVSVICMPLFFWLLKRKTGKNKDYKALGLFIILLVLAMTVFSILGNTAGSGLPGVNKGDRLPEVQLSETINMEDFRGEVVILNFWATWCPPCQAEMPEINRFAADYEDEVIFFAVNLTTTEKSAGAAEIYLRTHSYDMPLILDPKGELSTFFNIERIPTTLVIGPEGMILDRMEETISYDYLKSFLIK